MAVVDLNEKELRQIIEKKYTQWQNAEKRVDLYGSFKCIGQAKKYRIDYANLLRIAYQNGYSITDNELSVIELTVGGV